MSNKKPKPGHVWQCMACGKTNTGDLFNFDRKAQYGWDESCIMHAEQVAIKVPKKTNKKSGPRKPK